MIDSLVTKIKALLASISYPDYEVLYTTLLKANVELDKTKFTKKAVLIDWTDITNPYQKGEGVFFKPEFTVIFCKHMKLSETTENLRPTFIELESDILTFLRKCMTDKDTSEVEITGLSKTSDMNDENLIGYSLKFKIGLIEGVCLNYCP